MKFSPSLVQTRTTSPLGEIALAASERGLAGLWFANQRYRPAQLDGPDAWPHDDHHPVLTTAVAQLADYFAGRRARFDVPLDINGGTIFQQSVWQALLKIPHGSTTSYSDIGQRIGNAAAVRAVGAAVGRNPISIIVPCHRVVGSTGKLVGFAAGVDVKEWLLQHERGGQLTLA